MLVLRFSHVFFGAIWVGMMAYQTFFLMPALAEVGPDAGKLMAALMRRRIPVILPIVALITLVSGFWLFQRLSGGAAAGLMRTPMGMAFGSGGAAALLAFLLGVVVMRPAMMRSTQLAQSLASASPEEGGGHWCSPDHGPAAACARRGGHVARAVGGTLAVRRRLPERCHGRVQDAAECRGSSGGDRRWPETGGPS